MFFFSTAVVTPATPVRPERVTTIQVPSETTPKPAGPSTTNSQPLPTPAPKIPNRPTQTAPLVPSQATTNLPFSTQTGMSLFTTGETQT